MGHCAALRTENQTAEGQMSIDIREVVTAMGGEIGERYVHQKLADHLREEVAKGASSHDVVAQAIIRLRNNDFLQTMRGILGPRALMLSLTGLGAGIAKILQTMGPEKFASILPDDQSHLVREVRYILQSLAPALIVGAIDGATDTWESDVHAAVAKVRSDDRSAKPQKRGALDEVYEILSADGIDYMREYGLLFPEWDANGQLQHDSLGSVILAGPNGKRFAEDWYKIHKGGEKEVPIDSPQNDQNQNGRGRGNQNQQQRFRKIQVPPEPYKGRLVPLPVAIMRLPVTAPMDPELIALAKAALTPKDPPPAKKEGLDALDEHGLPFTFNVSRTLGKLEEHERQFLRDFIQDISANAPRINMLGKELNAKAVDGCFDQETIETIIQHVQTWMGATLTLENKIRQAFTRAKRVLEGTAGATATVGNRVEMAIGEIAGAAGKIALASAFGLTTLFIMLLAIVLFGAFGVNLDRPLAVSWMDGLNFIPVVLLTVVAWGFTTGWLRFLLTVFAIAIGIPATILLTADLIGQLTPSEFAIALVAGAGFLACLELFSFTAIQGLLSLVTRFLPDIHKDWLVNKGRILIMFIAIHVGIFMMLLAVKTPLLLRFLICVPTFFALASQMGLSGYEFGEEARQRARKTLRLFGGLTIIVFIAVIVVLVCQLQNVSLANMFGWVTESRIVQSVLILSGAGFVAAKVVRRLEETSRTTTNGVVTEKLYRRNNWLRGIGIILVLGLTLWPWIGSDINARFEKKAPSSPLTTWFNQMTVPTPAAVPVSQTTSRSVLQPKKQSSVPATVQAAAPERVPPKRAEEGGFQKKADLTAEECAGYSFEWRQELHCP